MRDPEQIDVRELDPWPPRVAYVGNRGDVMTTWQLISTGQIGV